MARHDRDRRTRRPGRPFSRPARRPARLRHRQRLRPRLGRAARQEGLRSAEAAVAAARALDFPGFVLTARAENFLRGQPDLGDTIARLQAYEAAGADVLFAPGLPDPDAVRAVCAALKKPFNFMVGMNGTSWDGDARSGGRSPHQPGDVALARCHGRGRRRRRRGARQRQLRLRRTAVALAALRPRPFHQGEGSGLFWRRRMSRLTSRSIGVRPRSSARRSRSWPPMGRPSRSRQRPSRS